MNKCNRITAIDFSPEMLNSAKEKITDNRVHFEQADIAKPWTLDKADFITCSLVLEHIQDLHFI